MSQRIVLPNGDNLDFPDGMADKDIETAIQSEYPEYAPKESLLSKVGSAAKSAASGIIDQTRKDIGFLRDPSVTKNDAVMEQSKEFEPSQSNTDSAFAAMGVDQNALGQSIAQHKDQLRQLNPGAEESDLDALAYKAAIAKPAQPKPYDTRHRAAALKVAGASDGEASVDARFNQQLQNKLDQTQYTPEQGKVTQRMDEVREGAYDATSIGDIFATAAKRAVLRQKQGAIGIGANIAKGMGSDATEGMLEDYQAVGKEIDAATPALRPDSWKSNFISAVDSTAQMLPAIVSGIVLKNPSMAVALTPMLLQEGGNRAGDMLVKGYGAADAAAHGIAWAAAEGVPEAMSLGFFFKLFGKAAGARQMAINLLEYAGTEVATENLTSLTEHLLQKYSDKPDLTADDLVKNLKDTTISTLMALPMMSGAGTVGGMVKSAPDMAKLGINTLRDQTGLGRAMSDAVENTDFTQRGIDAGVIASMSPNPLQVPAGQIVPERGILTRAANIAATMGVLPQQPAGDTLTSDVQGLAYPEGETHGAATEPGTGGLDTGSLPAGSDNAGGIHGNGLPVDVNAGSVADGAGQPGLAGPDAGSAGAGGSVGNGVREGAVDIAGNDRNTQGGQDGEKKSTRIQSVGIDENAVPQPKRQVVHKVRGSRDIRLPGVEGELSGVSDGDRGTPNPATSGGQNKQRLGIPAGQRQMGDAERAGKKSEGQYDSGVRRRDDDIGRLGEETRNQSIDSSRADTEVGAAKSTVDTKAGTKTTIHEPDITRENKDGEVLVKRNGNSDQHNTRSAGEGVEPRASSNGPIWTQAENTTKLSIGTAPGGSEPITVKDGAIFIGKYPAQHFETGEDITVKPGASKAQIRDALKAAGAIGRGVKVFGVEKEAPKSKVKAKRIVDNTRDSLITAIGKLGGFHTDSVEANDIRTLLGVTGNMKIPVGSGLPVFLFNKNGKKPDDMAGALHEQGYLDEHDMNDMLDKLYNDKDQGSKYAEIQRGEELEQEHEGARHGYDDLPEVDQAAVSEVVAEAEDMLDDIPFLDIRTANKITSKQFKTIEEEEAAIFGDSNETTHEGAAAGTEDGHGETDARGAQSRGEDHPGEAPGESAGVDSPSQGFSLESQTEASRREHEQEIADSIAGREADQRKADAEAKRISDQKEIDARMGDSVDHFRLGQSAEESLAGQGDIFGQQDSKQASQQAIVEPNPQAEAITKMADAMATMADAVKQLVNPVADTGKQMDTAQESATFIKQGDFWNYSGNRVKEIAKALGLTVSERNGVPMIGIPDHTKVAMAQEMRDAGIDVAFEPAKEGNGEEANTRDRFTLERLNRDTNQMEPVSFERGEYVRYTLSGKDVFGEIDGISQANREFSVDGLWYPFGFAYKAEKPSEYQKPTVPLSSVIDSANRQHGADLDYADRIHTLAVQVDLFRRIREGTVSADEFKASFEALLKNKAGIVAELEAMTKPQIFQKFPSLAYRYKNEKKADGIEAAYRDMISDFTLGESYSYGMSSGSRIDSIRALVDKTTDETLADVADGVKKRVEERAAAQAEALAGMDNPETLEDYQRIMAAKASEMGEGATYQEVRMSLPAEQRAHFDELAATKTRSDRASRKEARQEQTLRAPGEAVTASEIIKTRHTKHGHDLWQFNLDQRVSTEEFKSLVSQAKRLGGDYSSYRGNGAIPGWQFRTEEAANAFKALVAGDTTDAKEVMQTRRDAYADDRSQSAVERLTEMADKLEGQADASLNQERKANTAKRARQAASAESAANGDKAMAQTMRNIAKGIQDGTAKMLDKVRQKIQVEMLQGFVHTSQSDMLRNLYPSYADQERHKGENPTAETADYATFPSYTAYRSDLASLGRALLETEGTKKLGQRIMKVADDMSDVYLKFAKENLDKVASFRTKDGERAAFPSKAIAEAAIQRSGYKGAAIVLSVKRNENQIILSPSEAIKRGVWTGDNDKRITLSGDFGAELVEKIGKAARRGSKISVPWQFENAYDKRKRLAGMDIETPAELRAALREFIALREAPQESDKIKQMERAMIGRKNDGLDFFPTSASVADEMIESADIREGMSVLEPSAGMGHIADRIREAGFDPDVVELSSERKELLEAKGFRVVGRDFMDIKPREFFTYGDTFKTKDGTEGIMHGSGGLGSNRVGLYDKDGLRKGWFDRDELIPVAKNGTESGYDRILMNPPFGDRRDAEHVQHAYEMLKPGGRLVAIMGEGVFFGNDKKAQEFRNWMERVGATDEKLEAGSFMDPALPVNTSVSARMVVINKETDQGTALFHRAWHGSPHDHDGFSMDHVGTGEGAQAYGYGLYFAGSREVAEWYKNNLSGLSFERNGERLSPGNWAASTPEEMADAYAVGRLLSALKHINAKYLDGHSIAASATSLAIGAEKDARLYNDPAASKRESMVAERLRQFAEDAKSGALKATKGKLYQVELAPSEDEYLDWDKPLSEQSEKVKAALSNSGVNVSAQPKERKINGKYQKSQVTLGKDFYRELSERMATPQIDSGWTSVASTINDMEANDKAASEYLHSIGIRGIRYLDGAGRSVGEGDHNYVIFDDKDVSITEKFKRGNAQSGQPKAAVEAMAKKIMAHWKSAPVLTVVQSIEELPANLLEQVYSQNAQDDMEGVYLTDSKQVYLVADHLPTMQRALQTLLHESIGHHGLRGVFGDGIKPVMTQIYLTNKSVRIEADKLMKQYGYDAALATEEVLADMPGEGAIEKLNGWRRIVSYIMGKLRQWGVTDKWTDSDVISLLAKTSRNVIDGEGNLAMDISRSALASRYNSERGIIRRMEAINNIGDLRILLGSNKEDLYVRWSNSPEHDLKENAASRDYVSGVTHSGLSAVPIDRKMTDALIASRLHEYSFLRMKDGKLSPHIYRAERVGTDSDGYSLIKPIEFVGRISDEFVKKLDDNRYHELLQKQEELDDAEEYVRKGNNANDAMRGRYLKNLAEHNAIAQKIGEEERVNRFSNKHVSADSSAAISAAWRILSGDMAAFQNPTPDSFEMEQGAREIDPGMKAVEDKPDMDEEKAGIVKKWYVTMPDNTHAWIRENKKGEVWLDASDLAEGVSGGAKLYLLVGNYAEANGKVFIGDPAGLSDVALIRRTENMLSLALRFGSTRFLEPHEYQMNPEAKHDTVLADIARPITWVTGNDENNLSELLKTSYDNTINLFPEIKDVTYNFDRQRFEQDGAEFTDFDGIVERGIGALRQRGLAKIISSRKPGGAEGKAKDQPPIGSATLKRTALTNTFSRAASEGRGRSLLDEIGRIVPGGLSGTPLQGILYSRQQQIPGIIQPTVQPPRQSGLGITGTPGNNATWDAPEPSKFDNVIYELQNKHVDTKRVIEAINKNGQIKDSFDPYLQEELYHKRTAKRVSDFQAQELKPLLVEMTQRGVDVAQMEEYLHARHAKEANAHIADINPGNPDMQDGGSGMTNQEADDYLNGLAPERKKTLAMLAGNVDAMIAKTRQTLVDYRIESGDTIQSWADAYQHYVPLFREDVGSGPGTGQGFSVRGSSSKARTGSKRKVVDILGNIAMQRERAVARGEKNRVALALYGLAKTNPNPDFWTADKAPTQRVVDKATHTVVTQTDPLFKSRENVVVSRMVNPQTGKVEEHAVVFNERDERAMRMAAALKNLDMDDLGHVLGLAAKGTRYFASINTQYNPVFGLMNVTRDIQGALVNLSSTPLAGHQKEVLQHTLSAMRGIYSDIRDHRRGVTPSSKWATLWEEMQNEGGTTGYSELFRTSEDRAKALESEIKQISEGKIKQAGRAIFDWLSDYNETMENAVRLAAYKTSIDNGMSKPRAASLAKTLTVNFNRKGRMGSQAGALYAFFNASMQGTARMAEALKGPAGKKIILGGLTIGVMQAMALAMAGFDDDEPPEFVRERNLIIPLTPVSGKKNYITIPMPLGLHIIPNVGRLATELALGGFRHSGDKVIKLLNVLMDAFNPIGSATALQTITPTLIDPIAALAENKDWTGKPIYREERNGMNPAPGFTRAKDTSSVYSRWAAEAINTLSGGTKYQPGKASPTPDQIDYLIGQVTGGVGRELGKVEQAIESAYTGEDLPAYKRPLLGRLYGDSEEGASQAGRFYDNLKRINGHEAEIKGRAVHHEEYRSYLANNPEAKLIGPANEAENTVRHLNKQKRMLIEKEAPRAQIKQIEAQITAKMTKFNDKVKAANP